MDRDWKLTDHACRVCLGRVLIRSEEGGGHRVRCAECGAEAEGGAASICACGQKDRGGRDAGLRCVRNSERGAETPQEVVVVSVPPSQRRRDRKPTDCAKDGAALLPEVVGE